MKNVFVILFALVSVFALEDFAHAQLFGRRDTVRVRVRGDDVRVRANGNSAVAVNAFGGNRNAVAVNVNNGFAPARVNVVRVNAFHQPAVRVNAFGTRVVADGFGNIFEVDAFGNSRIVGNQFNRGFQGTVFRSSSFGSFNSFGAVPFAGCCH